MPDSGRHAAGCAGGAPQPPGPQGGWRDARQRTGAPGRAAGPRPHRQRAQAVPGHAGVLPARPRHGAARRPRPATGQCHAQCGLATGARRGRGGPAQHLPALASLSVRPGGGQATVVHATDVRAARGQSGAGVGAQPGHRPSGHHLLQPGRRHDHLRSTEPARPADERPPVPLRPHRLRQERHAEQHPQPGHGDLPAQAVHRRGRQQLWPVR